MGIDIGFTDESLARSKYARCAPYRRKAATFYSDAPQEGSDELAPYREADIFVNMARLKAEQPHLYQVIYNELRRVDEPDLWYWNESWFGHIYKDRRMKRRLKPYIEEKPSARVTLEKMPGDLASEWIERVGQDNVTNAWYDRDYRKNLEVCKPCPIRPLDETNCYLRFSSYPGMQSFKEGLLLTAAYAGTIDNDRLKDAWFSFPHLDRKSSELPKDKLQELYEMCEGAPVRKGAETFFNKVAEMLEHLKPDGLTMDGSPLDTSYMPFADELASRFIYRDEPYGVAESRELLPYLETFKEVADWAVWDTDSRPIRARILAFGERMGSLITALKIADKYELEVYMSY